MKFIPAAPLLSTVLPPALLRLLSRGLLSIVEGSEVAWARLLPLRIGPLPAQYTMLMAVVGCLNSSATTVQQTKHYA
jgi:hypothetical protein